VTVYVPNAPVDSFTPGVSCPISGAPPSGSPLVGTITDVNGKFSLVDMPVGSNIPLVIVSGRWRRILQIPGTTACTNTVLPPTFAVMPQNQNQGDIPKIAIATGAVDQVECVLLKMGISQTEFTDPSLSGRINLYTGTGGPGAVIDSATLTQASLMGGDNLNDSPLSQYDVLMLPCQGTPDGDVDSDSKGTGKATSLLGQQELANFIAFANAGGRVYSSHYSYAWMFQNPPFNGVANWLGSNGKTTLAPDPGTTTVNTGFTAGQTLATWLQNVGATTIPGQMLLDTLKQDTTGVIAPTQSWLTLNNTTYGDPVMQFVFDTPIPSATNPTPNQCGRVLYNEYHVENGSSSPAKYFPTECSAGAMTPQEKLLEYMLFELTDEGGQPSLAPTSQDFGPEAVTYPSAPQTFTWTNNSSFAAQVSSVVFTGTNAADFNVTSNGCGAVAGGASCTITVVFTPSLLGAESATLNVLSAGITLTATLTGTGVPGFTLTPGSLSFGNQDLGWASAPQTLTLTSNASGPLAVPMFVTTLPGEYAVNQAACGSSLAALGSCQIGVTFKPAATGAQSGTVAVSQTNLPGPGSLIYSGVSATLSGTGVDFTISLNPVTGSVVAGDGTTTTATITPIAGFSAPLFVSCTVAAGAAATVCSLSSAGLTPPTVVTTVVSIGTTSQYTVIGYSGFGGRGLLWLIALASGWLLWRRRRSGRAFLPHLKIETPTPASNCARRGPRLWGTRGLLVALLAVLLGGLTSCTGKLPAENAAWTAPGNYTVTVTATDGQLSHSATYSLTVR
jgi:hypothetical protein